MHFLLSCPIGTLFLCCQFLPCHLHQCHVLSCCLSPSCMSCFKVVFICFPCTRPPSSQYSVLILLVTALLLPTSVPVIVLYFIRLFVILISTPFTITVSLASSAVRHSTFQHPTHWEVKPYSVVSAHDFKHPDKAKSTKL